MRGGSFACLPGLLTGKKDFLYRYDQAFPNQAHELMHVAPETLPVAVFPSLPWSLKGKPRKHHGSLLVSRAGGRGNVRALIIPPAGLSLIRCLAILGCETDKRFRICPTRRVIRSWGGLPATRPTRGYMREPRPSAGMFLAEKHLGFADGRFVQ